MKQKKNIDTIFNEGFKNIEAAPSPRVWENIQTELKKEKKNRTVIPLWVQLGGVAALVALLLTVGNSLYKSTDYKAPSVTEGKSIEVDTKTNEGNSEIETKLNSNKLQVASEENSLQKESSQDLNVSDKTNSEEKNNSNNTSEKLFNTSEKSNGTVIASSNSEKRNSETKGNLPQNIANERIAISKNPSAENSSQEQLNVKKEQAIEKETEIFGQSTEKVVAVEKNDKNNSGENLNATAAEKAENKKSIFDAIAEAGEKPVSEKKNKETPEHRWNVAPNVAPVYYSSLGNGSSIDPSFSDNPQKGDVNISYGVQVSYALNNRLSVRTGINNVDLSYNTTGVDVGTGPVSVALSTVDYGSRDVVVTAVDQGSLSVESPSNGFGEITPKSTQGSASLIQNINYYEVPLELKYAVLNSKLGVNLIGGVSTLFLGNNEISVKADNFNTVLGEANNLSSVSFSTNVGLGLDYKLSKKFTFNIEPMFKYQLNPYTDSSVNFKPYYLGVYSGLSFKF